MNRVVHFEIHASDPEKVNKFCTELFGWKIEKFPGGEDYWLASTGADGAGINGGIMKSRDGEPRTVNTVEVESVDSCAEMVREMGGRVVVDKMAIPGVGFVAYCTDPCGNLFGVYQHDPSAA